MREFNLDLLISKNVAVNCKTKEEEEDFLQYLDSKNIKWNSGDSIFKHNYYSYNHYESSTCFTLLEYNNEKLQYSPIEYFQEQNYKIITLDDLVIKPKNNFKEYGFEADFEGEILIVKDDKYFGISKSNESEGWVANGWKKDGTCLYDYVSHLKPIKKEWYENPDNIGKFVIDIETNKILILFDYIKELNQVQIGFNEKNRYYIKVNKVRPLTKEEILPLLIKED